MSAVRNPRSGREAARARFAALAIAALVLSGWASAGLAAALTAPGPPPAAPLTAYVAKSGLLAARAISGLPADALAGDTSPSAAAQRGGGFDVAQGNDEGDVQVVGSNGTETVFDTQIAPGTSPSIIGLYLGAMYAVAFRARSGALMLAAPGSPPRSLGATLAPLTSPSIGASAGGCCEVAFQGANGDLYVWTPVTGVRDTGQPMALGTSPSLAETRTGDYEVAFQGAGGDLLLYGGGRTIYTGLTMARQTSPSIAVLSTGAGYEVAFASAERQLSLLATATQVASNAAHVLASGSSPSIASLAGGGWIVAFVDRSGRLTTETASGRVTVTARRVAAGTSPAEAASPPIPNPSGAGMFGIATDGAIEGESAATLSRDLDYAAGAGARWLRVDINWASIQAHGPGSYSWTRTDRVVKRAEALGMKVLGTLIYTPPWAAARPSCRAPDCAPQAADFAAFARAAAAHYAPLGVNAYEVWSEENSTAQWLPRPSPAAYTALLKAAYPAIKRADPKALVITGGTSPSLTNRIDYSPPAFLAALYRDGAKGYFDAVGVHPYCWPAYPGQPYTWSAWYQTYGAPTSMRSLMVAHGDGRKPIWGTEFGAATYGPKGSYVSTAAQAQSIVRGFALWSTYRWAGPLLVFEGRDQKSQAKRDTMWNYLGLLFHNFAKKPAFSAFRHAAALY